MMLMLGCVMAAEEGGGVVSTDPAEGYSSTLLILR